MVLPLGHITGGDKIFAESFAGVCDPETRALKGDMCEIFY